MGTKAKVTTKSKVKDVNPKEVNVRLTIKEDKKPINPDSSGGSFPIKPKK